MEALFEAFGIRWEVLLVQSVNFGVLLIGLTYFLYKPVLKMLRDRQQAIAKGVEDAEKAAKQVSEIEAQKTDILSKAERDAEAIVERGVREGKTEKAHIVEKAQAQSDTILEDARLQAEELKKKAERESKEELARTAILAAETILKKS